MARLVLFLMLTSLLGCSSTRNQERNVTNREVAMEPGAIPYGRDHYPYRTTSFKDHEMRIINNGMGAFYQRIDMIRRAKTSLDLEYFIFNPDTAGKIVIRELVAAAKRGVTVRVLVDKSLAVFALDEYYAMVFRENAIQLRYYNPAYAVQISSVQFRNHRKLIIRDGEEAITGGRNIADEYFNLSKEFNFLDRDVWVQGDIVKPMGETFNLYWNSDIVEIPKYLSKPKLIPSRLLKYNKKMSEAKAVVLPTAEENNILAFALDYGKKVLHESKVYKCPEVTFATDREGASFLERLEHSKYEANYRLLKKEISEWMEKVTDEVILDSPYFLKDEDTEYVLNKLLNVDKRRVTIFTNSLASTDAVYVSTVFNSAVKRYTDHPKFNAYVYKGQYSSESELYNKEILNSQWGTHSKTIVYNDHSFMVGTYNIDHRSNFYNTEMGLFCAGSAELARDIKENINLRMKSSYHLNKDGAPDDGTPLLAGNSSKKKRLYFYLKIPATIAQFLL